jgi:hypothetical protein
MSDLLNELARQIPNAVAVIIMAWLFLTFERQREERRIKNAEDLEKERRQHELHINNMWATYIKQLVASQNEAFESIAQTLAEHERASRERYERMGITDALIQAAKEKK